jgi:hypothetical protein
MQHEKKTENMDHYTIERTGIPNLDFEGEIIGSSGGTNPHVKIYRTKGLQYVAQINANMKFSQAQHFDKRDGVISYFRNVAAPSPLPQDYEDAIEDAAVRDDGFKALWNEHVN